MGAAADVGVYNDNNMGHNVNDNNINDDQYNSTSSLIWLPCSLLALQNESPPL